jgi:hypothetical protein
MVGPLTNLAVAAAMLVTATGLLMSTAIALSQAVLAYGTRGSPRAGPDATRRDRRRTVAPRSVRLR